MEFWQDELVIEMKHKVKHDFNLKIEQEWLNADLHTVQSE